MDIGTMKEINYNKSLPEPTSVDYNGIAISTYIIEDGTWFLTDNQVAKNYGIKHGTVKAHVHRNIDILIEGKDWFYKKGKLPKNYPRLRLWTKDGFIKVGNYIKTKQAENVLVALGIKTRQTSTIESNIAEIIKSSLKDITKTRIKYRIPKAGYIVDLYFPDLNLVVEIDEYNHKNYSKYEEKFREEIIRSVLNCEIIRYDPHNPKSNVGILLNKVFMKILNDR
jgi:very-short-patch-repair endonuclease